MLDLDATKCSIDLILLELKLKRGQQKINSQYLVLIYKCKLELVILFFFTWLKFVPAAAVILRGSLRKIWLKIIKCLVWIFENSYW